MARTLQYLVPDKTTEITLIADNVAANRERAGLNYRSDTEAGKELADRVFEILTSECAKFMSLLEEAKQTEWNPAHSQDAEALRVALSGPGGGDKRSGLPEETMTATATATRRPPLLPPLHCRHRDGDRHQRPSGRRNPEATVSLSSRGRRRRPWSSRAWAGIPTSAPMCTRQSSTPRLPGKIGGTGWLLTGTTTMSAPSWTSFAGFEWARGRPISERLFESSKVS
jgi:hypothetical protein